VAREKLYYKIGEACKILDIQPYVLRYWETEFSILSPSKSKSGQRVYGETDFALIQRIKELLYEEGFTIAGAKKKLESEIAAGGPKEAKPAAGKESTATPKAGTKGGAKKTSEAESEEVAKLRAGIEKALGEAREIMSLLDG
jgi:DNA-binding transcriptional MerR regulator